VNAQSVCGIAGQLLSQTRIPQIHDMLAGLQAKCRSAHPLDDFPSRRATSAVVKTRVRQDGARSLFGGRETDRQRMGRV